MSRSKNAKVTLDPVTTNVLDELFASDDDNPSIAFPVPVCVAIGRIFVAASHLGGMVTLYRGGPNNAYIVSVRVGDKRKAVEIDDAEGSAIVLEHLANAFEQAWAKVYLSRKRSDKAVEPSESSTPV